MDSDIQEFQRQNSQPGIYKITGVDDKFYIGSAWNTLKRFSIHIKKLKKNIHENKNIQEICNKYGLHYLSFSTLRTFLPEEIDRNQLYKLEQYYIDNFNPEYNIQRKTSYSEDIEFICGNKSIKKSNQPIKNKKISRYFIAINSLGQEYRIENLKKFCEENDLRRSAVTRVLNGKHSNTKGWKIRRSKDEKFLYKETKKHIWIITNPHGEEFSVVGLNGFCKKNGLSEKSMSKVANGMASHHKNWKCRRHRDNCQLYYNRRGKQFKITCPNGHVCTIRSLKKFCRESCLSYNQMLQVSNKKNGKL